MYKSPRLCWHTLCVQNMIESLSRLMAPSPPETTTAMYYPSRPLLRGGKQLGPDDTLL